MPGEWTARDILVALAVGAVAALLMFHRWGPPTYWESDGLFYEAQKHEVEGQPRQAALREVFASSLASELKSQEADEPASQRNISNPEWVHYSARFYRRRWAIPAAAAALDPLFGVDSLKNVALLGYVAATALLYLLLRCRFGTRLSMGIALASLLLPPVRHAAAEPSTDSWGLALLIAGLICAWLVIDRGKRWLAPWVLVILVLSFTRDLTIVLVITACWLAFRLRTRASIALALTGIAASIPAPLVAGAPFRENLAYVIDDFRVPTDTSWSYVLSHYPGGLLDVVRHDFTYPFDFSFPPPMVFGLLVILASFLTLVMLPARGDPFISLMRAALAGGAITILLSINFTNWRLELAMLPSAAVGLALLIQLAMARLRPEGQGGATGVGPSQEPRPATPG
jgi:hypothetical protein